MGRFMEMLSNDLLAAVGVDGRLMAIDGVDGSGKTTFAAELATAVRDRPVIVIHADNFLNPTHIRYSRGRNSPEGFWKDTYNYTALHELVLEPLGPAGEGWYSPASYDPVADRTAPSPKVHAPAEALVVVEGMFLHRDELIGYWDASVFLDVPFTVTAARMAVRDGSNPDPDHPSMRRYVDGQQLYLDATQPWERATVVVDNSAPASPEVVRSNTPRRRCIPNRDLL
ncbi:uridine kinase [Arthrobacter echini]|nr:uridine kinase [Arthrobacter echini]